MRVAVVVGRLGLSTCLVSGVLSAGCSPPLPSTAGTASPSSSSAATAVVPDDYVAVATFPGGVDPTGLFSMTATAVDASFVVGPHYYLGLDAVGVAAQLATTASRVYFYPVQPRSVPTPLPSGWTLSPSIRASAGHELVIGKLTEKPGKTLNGDTGVGAASIVGVGDVSVSIQVGQQHPVDLGSNLENGSLIVVSVPTGGDPIIAIDDGSGHVQSLHLRTGQRAGAVTILYPTRTEAIPTPVVTTVLETLDGKRYIPTLGLQETVSLVPWEYSHGWAGPGRAWLILSAEASSPLGPVSLELDAAKTFTLTGAGGTLHALPGTLTVDTLGLKDKITAMFDVPASFRTGTLRTVPAGRNLISDKPQPIVVYAQRNATAAISLPA